MLYCFSLSFKKNFEEHSISKRCADILCKLIFVTSPVPLPLGDPTEGVGGGAEAAGEKDCRGGEDEAAGAG